MKGLDGIAIEACPLTADSAPTFPERQIMISLMTSRKHLKCTLMILCSPTTHKKTSDTVHGANPVPSIDRLTPVTTIKLDRHTPDHHPSPQRIDPLSSSIQQESVEVKEMMDTSGYVHATPMSFDSRSSTQELHRPWINAPSFSQWDQEYIHPDHLQPDPPNPVFQDLHAVDLSFNSEHSSYFHTPWEDS